jgi:hypothetical protein
MPIGSKAKTPTPPESQENGDTQPIAFNTQFFITVIKGDIVTVFVDLRYAGMYARSRIVQPLTIGRFRDAKEGKEESSQESSLCGKDEG